MKNIIKKHHNSLKNLNIGKNRQQNTDNVLPLKFDLRSVYTNIKANITTFESVNTNLLFYVCQAEITYAGMTFS
jgi:hypothetical protein